MGSFSAKFKLEDIHYKYSISREALQEPWWNILTYSGLVTSLGQGKWHLLFNFTDQIDNKLEKFHIKLTNSVSPRRWVAGWRRTCWFWHEFETTLAEEWVRNNPHIKASERDKTKIVSAHMLQKGKCKTHAYPFKVNHLVSVSATKISIQIFLKWDSFTMKHSRQVPISVQPFMTH